MSQPTLWIIFSVVILALLVLDLGVLNRKQKPPTLRSAIGWTILWVSLALAFMLFIAIVRGNNDAMTFLAGYLLEQSLSIDNLFVFIMIFRVFQIQSEFQHKILFWGIIGAIAMRAIFIFLGIAIIQNFAWMMYVFGALLIWMGIKTIISSEDKTSPEETLAVKLFKKFVPYAEEYRGNQFFTIRQGKRFATPLLLALFIVEFSDVIFAVDSVPAVLSISSDSFIVYTSNIFAILGLRSLYFVLVILAKEFHYLKYGISIILALVGVKMILAHHYEIPVSVTLLGIFLVLAISIVMSLLNKNEN